MRYRFARPEGTRARLLNALPLRYMSAITKRSGKNVRFVRFYPPPPPDYYTKGIVLFSFAEAVAAGRRPESATGSGSAGCLHDRHCTTLLYWCAAGRKGAGASQDGGEFLATSGELHWDAQPATLDNPKSGMHPKGAQAMLTLRARLLSHRWHEIPI